MSNIRIVEDEEGNLLPQTPAQALQDALIAQRPVYTAESGLQYPEILPPDDDSHVGLDLTNTVLELYITDIAKLPPQEFTMSRRNGFGGSDSGVLLGVSPYDTIEELIKQKASKTLSAEEIATSEQVAVIKGNDLEPVATKKFENFFQMKTVKPTDMYTFIGYEYLKMNFDGVTGTPAQYLPVEVKIVTRRGEKHYDPFKTLFTEREGFKAIPPDYASNPVNSIVTKASQYGIPPYYYTQLQMQMMALKAPYGYLCTLWEYDWKLHVYFVHKDERVWNELKIAGWKAWQQVEALKEKNNAVQRISIISPEDEQPQTREY